MKTNNFSDMCYSLLKKVPKGKITTYKEIANDLKIRNKNNKCLLILVRGRMRNLSETNKKNLKKTIQSLGGIQLTERNFEKLSNLLKEIKQIPMVQAIHDQNKVDFEYVAKDNRNQMEKVATMEKKYTTVRKANAKISSLSNYKNEINKVKDIIKTYRNVPNPSLCINNSCIKPSVLQKYADGRCMKN